MPLQNTIRRATRRLVQLYIDAAKANAGHGHWPQVPSAPSMRLAAQVMGTRYPSVITHGTRHGCNSAPPTSIGQPFLFVDR
ncbi:hypothetical protein BKA18_002059 [Streptomyces auratus]